MKMNLQESSHYYDSEKYYNQSPGIAAGSPDLGGWEPGMGDDSLHSIPVRITSLGQNNYDDIKHERKNLNVEWAMKAFNLHSLVKMKMICQRRRLREAMVTRAGH